MTAHRITSDGTQKTGVPKVDSRLKEDDVLWRYLNTEKFFDFVNTSKLYLTRGDQFPDKFEGTFTRSTKLAIGNSYKANNVDCTYDEFKRQLRGRVFLNCWRASPHDSMAMWRLYGQSDNAVAITTTVGKLADAIVAANLPHFIYLNKVNYINHWRDPSIKINPYSNVFSYKVKAYEYEEEARVIVDRFEKKSDFGEWIEETQMPVTVSQNNLLRTIVVSPTAPKSFVLLVRKTVKERGITADVHRSMLWFKPI